MLVLTEKEVGSIVIREYQGKDNSTHCHTWVNSHGLGKGVQVHADIQESISDEVVKGVTVLVDSLSFSSHPSLP